MTTMQLPPEIQKLMGEMWAEIQQSSNRKEEARAKVDPTAHKLSRVFANSAYLYLRAGKDGRGREVRFCWSTHRNVAGYFLGWREVVGKQGGKRDRWTARRVRARVKEIAERRGNTFRAQREPAETRVP